MSEPLAHASSHLPDPGTRASSRIAWFFTVVLLGAVVFMNQCASRSASQASQSQTSPATIQPPDIMEQSTLMGKLMVRMAVMDGSNAEARSTVMLQIDSTAVSPLARLRNTIIAAEVLGIEEARTRTQTIKNENELPELVQQEIPLFEKVFENDKSPVLSDTEREQLITRHGWYGKLAMVRGIPDNDPTREQLLGGGGKLVALTTLLVVVLVIASLGALTFSILAIVKIGNGKFVWRFVPPAAGGSVFLEMVAVFIAGFLALKLVLTALAINAPVGSGSHLLKVQLIAQWVLVLLCFYPLFRGKFTMKDFRQRLGWTSGRGVFTEIGCGIAGYLACLPFFVVGAVITLIYVLIKGAMAAASGEAPQAIENPIIDLVMSASNTELILLFVLATCWAPLVEEAVFRGGMYRHLRGRLGLIAAAGISALAFGLMHGYELFMLMPVISLGFGFAFLREWRGSLIAPMTAHFIHNATVLTFMLSILSFIKD